MRVPSPIMTPESSSNSYFNDLKNFLRKKFGVSDNGNIAVSSKVPRGKELINSSYERLLAEKNRLKCAEDIKRFDELYSTQADYETQIEIHPISLDFFCTLNQLKKSLNTPLKIHKKQAIPHHTVAFIKRKSWKFKYTTQFHFYKNQLFYIHTSFSPGHLAPNLLKREIYSLFVEKYLKQNPELREKETLCLVDKTGHKIMVTPKLGVDVHYFASSEAIKNELLDIYDADQIEKKRLLKKAKDDFMEFL